MPEDLDAIDRLWAKGIKVPVETLEDLDRLDGDEIVQGFRDYRRDDPEPGNNRSRAYWHGWRNRRDDDASSPASSARVLAKAFVGDGRFMKMLTGEY